MPEPAERVKVINPPCGWALEQGFGRGLLWAVPVGLCRTSAAAQTTCHWKTVLECANRALGFGFFVAVWQESWISAY